MDTVTDLVSFLSGLPAIGGLIVTAVVIFLTADWRLSLSSLLVQYILIGVTLSRFIRPELVVVKVLAGALVAPILYITARRIHEVRGLEIARRGGRRFLGLQFGWAAGPLGLPLRLLAVVLVILAILRLFADLQPTLVPYDIAFVACWLAGMGLIGLVLSGEPLRVAPAVLTILSAFDLVYASLEQNLAIVGLFSALMLLAALAFSYLAAVQGLRALEAGDAQEGAEL